MKKLLFLFIILTVIFTGCVSATGDKIVENRNYLNANEYEVSYSQGTATIRVVNPTKTEVVTDGQVLLPYEDRVYSLVNNFGRVELDISYILESDPDNKLKKFKIEYMPSKIIVNGYSLKLISSDKGLTIAINGDKAKAIDIAKGEKVKKIIIDKATFMYCDGTEDITRQVTLP